MSEYPKFKLPDNPTLVVEQTDKALAKKLDVNSVSYTHLTLPTKA